ncbi:hypothetical protein C0Q70_03385 [Pomacea canaliculata]|uniref:Uncharacterized protein n=1 Tax=Pomacea canaliculata TaxID=400727 RepID=A0A2T7PSJ7_POMCA|nr:hypothetical protein C0Q70_03385 [Pomacea canaliculata]
MSSFRQLQRTEGESGAEHPSPPHDSYHKPKPLTPEEAKALTQRYLDVAKKIHEYEKRNIPKTLSLKKEHLASLMQATKESEENYKKATAKVAQEKADVDKLQTPSVRAFFKDQESFDEKMSKEQEEYLEAVSEQEVAKKQLDMVTAQKKPLEEEVATLSKEMEALMKMHDDLDIILGLELFNGRYGSELENKLETECEVLLDKNERIMAAKYKWTYAQILLQHAVRQLWFACCRWIELSRVPPQHLQQKYYMATEVRNNLIAASSNIVNAKRYLNNIRFPYCEPGEIATLQRACNNVYVDMRTPDRHQHAFQCYDVTFKRAAALLQWFDSVIKNHIDKDLVTVKTELQLKEKALRSERIRLMKEKIGPEAASLVIHEHDFDASDVKLDPEKVAVSKPDKPEGSGEAPEFDDKGPPASTPLPANELAPPPSAEELFGKIQQLKEQHKKEMEEFDEVQETNKTRMEQGLQEKIRARKNRRMAAMIEQ